MAEECIFCLTSISRHGSLVNTLGLPHDTLFGKAHINCLRFLCLPEFNHKAIFEALNQHYQCSVCMKTKATLRCEENVCDRIYHLGCAEAEGFVDFKNLKIRCQKHRLKKTHQKLGQCVACKFDVRDKDGINLMCCQLSLHSFCARKLVTHDGRFTCPSCQDVEEYQTDLQMLLGIYVPGTRTEIDFITEIDKQIRECKRPSVIQRICPNNRSKTEEIIFVEDDSDDSDVRSCSSFSNKDSDSGCNREVERKKRKTEIWIHSPTRTKRRKCDDGNEISSESRRESRPKTISGITEDVSVHQDQCNSPCSSVILESDFNSDFANSGLSAGEKCVVESSTSVKSLQPGDISNVKIVKAIEDPSANSQLTHAPNPLLDCQLSQDSNLILDSNRKRKSVIQQTRIEQEDSIAADIVELRSSVQLQNAWRLSGFNGNEVRDELLAESQTSSEVIQPPVEVEQPQSDVEQQPSEVPIVSQSSSVQYQKPQKRRRKKLPKKKSVPETSVESSENEDDKLDSKELSRKKVRRRKRSREDAMLRNKRINSNNCRVMNIKKKLRSNSSISKTTGKHCIPDAKRKDSRSIVKRSLRPRTEEASIKLSDKSRKDKHEKLRESKRLCLRSPPNIVFSSKNSKRVSSEKAAQSIVESSAKSRPTKATKAQTTSDDQNRSKKAPVGKSEIKAPLAERRIIHSRNGVLWAQSTEQFLPEDHCAVQQMMQNELNEIVDVNSGEKKFMSLWNDFIFQYKNFLGFVHLPELCRSFVESCKQKILDDRLYRNCILHFANLESIGAIDCSTTLELIDKLQKEIQVCTTPVSEENPEDNKSLRADSGCSSQKQNIPSVKSKSKVILEKEPDLFLADISSSYNNKIETPLDEDSRWNLEFQQWLATRLPGPTRKEEPGSHHDDSRDDPDSLVCTLENMLPTSLQPDPKTTRRQTTSILDSPTCSEPHAKDSHFR